MLTDSSRQEYLDPLIPLSRSDDTPAAYRLLEKFPTVMYPVLKVGLAAGAVFYGLVAYKSRLCLDIMKKERLQEVSRVESELYKVAKQ